MLANVDNGSAPLAVFNPDSNDNVVKMVGI